MLEGKVTNFDKQEFFAGAGARYKLSRRLENEIKTRGRDFNIQIGYWHIPAAARKTNLSLLL